MAVSSKAKRRTALLRLSGKRVEVATGLILALLWQARANADETTHNPASGTEPRIEPAIAEGAKQTLTLEELKTLLTPEQLAKLGFDPESFAALLIADPREAIFRLNQAFHAKLTLVSTGSHAATTDTAADAVTDQGGGPEHSGGISALALLGGLLGAGGAGGLALAVGGKGGSAPTPVVAVPAPNVPAPIVPAPVVLAPVVPVPVVPAPAVPEPAAPVPVVPAPAAPLQPALLANADTIVTLEDRSVTFDVRTNDIAAGGVVLAVSAINGTTITPTSAVAITGGVVSLDSDGRLTFTPAANYAGGAGFTYTIVDGKGGSATATVSLDVTPVNDAPVNSGPSTIAVLEGATALVSGLSIADVDAGTGVLTATLHVGNGALFASAISGGAAFAGSATSTLTLTGSLAQINATLGGITYRGVAGFSGNDVLTLTTTDGQASDTDSFAIVVTTVQLGVLSDGYVAGGTVFVDVNGNGVLDAGEPSAQTDASGRFVLATNLTGGIVAFGGTNTDTGLPNLITMRAVAGSTVVNPLTTVVAALVAGGITPADANVAAVAAFDLPAGTDLGHFDILAAADPALALQAQKAASQIAALLTLARGAADPGAEGGVEVAVLAKLSALVAADQFETGAGALSQLFSGITGLSSANAAAAALSGASITASIGAATSLGDLSTTVAATLVPGANLAPVARPDVIGIGIGHAVAIDVLANDRDPNGDTLSVTAVDGHAISVSTPVAVTGGMVYLSANGTLSFAPDQFFTGSPRFSYTVSDGHGGTTVSSVDVAITADGPILSVAAADLGAAIAHAGELSAAGVDSFDLVGDAGSIDDAHAAALIAAGLDFADADHVTLEASGTHLTTSLKGLQDLHVDSVAVGAGITMLTVDAGTHGLRGLNGGALPSFVTAQPDAAIDVTLTVASGQLDSSLDLTALAPALAASGIDHIAVIGDGHLAVTVAQATAVAASGLDFAIGADITLTAAPDAIAGIAARAADLAAVHVDHIDVIGDAATIADGDASALVSAGLDFADADTITLEAHGTHLATNLNGLQALHVDSVTAAAGITMLSIDAGGAGLSGLHAGGLPHFTPGLDVTLVQTGGLAATLDLAALAPALAASGIDHIAAGSSGALSVTLAQAGAVATAGLDFATASDISVRLGASDASTVVGHANELAAVHVDHLDLGGGALTLSDGQAGQLVAAGLDFADADHINVEAHGTHLATTLTSLQNLHVDTVQVETGVTALTVVAGDLAALAADHLPQFDIAQTDAALSVTLQIATSDIAELTRLATSLRDAGVDHIGISEPIAGLDAATLDLMAGVTALTGIDFVETAPPLSIASYSELLSDLQIEANSPATIALTDSAAAAVVESGMFASYVAENLAVDATAAGDRPLTTLKAIADLGVDAVTLADQHEKPVYIDLGFATDAPALVELQSLFAALTPGEGGYQRLFTGSEHVALVVDAATAEVLASVDGALGHLALLGFTEIDVLGGTSGGAIFSGHDPIEVKLIGEDDDLYDYLHHGKS